MGDSRPDAGEEQIEEGVILTGEDLSLVTGALVMRDGHIVRIEEARRAPCRWVCPALFNAHTHLADTVAMDYAAGGDLRALVTPPDGLKHRILATTQKFDLVQGMKASIGVIGKTGTWGFADFREGGRAGVRALREATLGGPCAATILGREGGEAIADGIGVSSIRDVPGAAEAVEAARRAGKKVAVHAGEADPHDIDDAIALSPDLLVHCTHATHAQLRTIAELAIPIAICPRSNWRFGVTDSRSHPPLDMMRDLGCQVLLGTDNVMMVQPDLTAEMAFLATVYHIPPHEVLGMAVRGALLAGTESFIIPGRPARYFVIDPAVSNLVFSRDIVTSVVNRAGSGVIVKSVFTP